MIKKCVFHSYFLCISKKLKWSGAADSTFLVISRLTTSTHWPYYRYFIVHVYGVLHFSHSVWYFLIQWNFILLFVCLFVCLMEFNATFNNISILSWGSVLLVEETGGPGENHQPVASHWQTFVYNCNAVGDLIIKRGRNPPVQHCQICMTVPKPGPSFPSIYQWWEFGNFVITLICYQWFVVCGRWVH